MRSTLLLLPTLFLLPALQQWHLEFWSFLYLFVHNLPQLLMQLFLVPYNFFVFYCPSKHCPGASTAAKGPRPQPVSGDIVFEVNYNKHHSWGNKSSWELF